MLRHQLDEFHQNKTWVIKEQRKSRDWLIVANPVFFVLRRLTFVLTLLYMSDVVVL